MKKRHDLMSQLILLRHDPELAQTLRAEALKGNTDAQYGTGLIYAEGRGVDQDAVEAYAWLSVAMLQGDPDAETLRDAVMQTLSLEQIRAAMERAGSYVASIERGNARH